MSILLSGSNNSIPEIFSPVGVEWLANTQILRGKYFSPSNGFVYITLNTGYTGLTQPVWPMSLNATVRDSEITWQCYSYDYSVDVSVTARNTGIWEVVYYDKPLYLWANNLDRAGVPSIKEYRNIKVKIPTPLNLNLVWELSLDNIEYNNEITITEPLVVQNSFNTRRIYLRLNFFDDNISPEVYTLDSLQLSAEEINI